MQKYASTRSLSTVPKGDAMCNALENPVEMAEGNLSRDDDRSDQELTKFFELFCSSQIPRHFKIVPLPAEIVSFLTSVLLKLPEKTQLQEKTHEDQARAWCRWKEYCLSVGIGEDLFLDSFSRHDRIRLMGAFAMAVREGRFSKQHDGTLAEGTVRGTISNVSTSFRENGRVNPTRDEDGELGRVLSRLFRAFKNKDPNPKQQKAPPWRGCSTRRSS